MNGIIHAGAMYTWPHKSPCVVLCSHSSKLCKIKTKRTHCRVS